MAYPPTVERTIEVELNRYVEDPSDSVSDPDELNYEPDEYVTWSAEWWLNGSSQSTPHAESELQELVDVVTRNLTRWGDHYVLHLDWTLRGDPPEDSTLDDAVAATGVVYPLGCRRRRTPTSCRQVRA
ncbi:hypothetical protein [Kribbella sp. NPDC004875]|uniref:hypothetical protein n=1 Tax=Kribbella sp. NPDC004875 TaxID=3364107 RepID=UPI0036A7BBA7